jgi:hypothetical protein
MIGDLVPGFKSAGHPIKSNRREDRCKAREERRARDDEYAEAVRDHESRHPAVRAMDEMVTADEVVDDPADWDPDRNDLAGVDTGPDWGPRSRPYAPEEEREIESMRSPRYRGDDPGYHHRPRGRATRGTRRSAPGPSRP